MHLDTVTDIVRRPSERSGAAWRDGDARLAGGMWLFSTEQPDPRRLIDLTALGGDRGIAEYCINPVASALANAYATGIRYRARPRTPERSYRRLTPIPARPAR